MVRFPGQSGTIERENTVSIETTTEAEPLTEEHAKLVADQIQAFNDYEATLQRTREFWAKHQATILKFKHEQMYVFLNKLEFPGSYGNDPKEVARAFGADGWTRVRNPYTCGAIDWKKVVDGVEIVIANAETAPALLPQVRIPE